MNTISKHIVVTSMVRGFFDSFFSGLLDSKAQSVEEKRQPRLLKQLVAACYENMSGCFSNVMFPLLLGMNFESYDKAVEAMQAHHFSNDTSHKLLLRFACQSKPLYDTLVAEYRRQMETLLLGHIQSVAEHVRTRKPMPEGEEMDSDHAIRAVVRAEMHGYALGIKVSGTGRTSLHQPTVFRLMAEGMATLLHDEETDVWADMEKIGLDGVYRRVCKDARNYETLINEMNQAYEDLATAEGIVSASGEDKKDNK